ncbi:MAG: hypothetical protein UU48_C0001G0041 [Candidatus Uhrbacteria bacterium GW2011_GWF2_41_16]|jgi:hypothetical protein|uniref:Metallophosphoesterase n=2 Tax=Candidatus Uhriibacteriota TaxID=1752732 RepID=A0A0G0VGC9_9BACT|nr:MAG: hypothetical protein UU31_C0002G0148 [Candidatus Uhrbacteria bacterium GW2011_GWA2_41_10]KKR87747.1 MAG: hypothetical protein UU35_C0001G0028 [Candidatus Uhrbacteria bacterium GW2011_GWC2_41_11]KKR98686.1 MAG: hypothetical protein UU48_C0001G0041 [Candidatus Uhrbacteria bacterium GW2011_GWF2_41_16]HBO99614.1 metallophosphoesterase [Candidatus Uhrbacteria bacterium]
MVFLIFGDIVGRIGREAIKRMLPDLRSVFKPDLVIANAENLAHGTGASIKTIEEMRTAGVNIFTSGNHIFDRKDAVHIFEDSSLSQVVLRPANYPPKTMGQGWTVVENKEKTILILNLMGRVFFNQHFDDPFRIANQLIDEHPADFVLIDLHAEATSEKSTFGLYLDGRATVVWGTHTHVPTADERLLPKGTAYITDIGMSGGMNGSIGVQYEAVRDLFLNQRPVSFEVIEHGMCEINAILVHAEDGQSTHIERIRRMIEIE